MIDEQSEKVLKGLYPPFAEKLRQLIGVLGEGWRVDEGFRAFQEQDAFYEQGRSRPGALITRERAGYSAHNYGTAAHVRPIGDDDTQGYNAKYFQLATEAGNVGLDWGGRRDGNNKFVEMSRVEMITLPLIECLTIYKQGRLPAVWAAFDEKLGIVKEDAVAEKSTETEDVEPENEPKNEPKDSPVVARHKKDAKE